MMLAFTNLTICIHAKIYANLSLGLHEQISLLKYTEPNLSKFEVHININYFLVIINFQRIDSTIKTLTTNNRET